jgi:hypothetical protein
MRVTISIRGYRRIGVANERRLLDWTTPDDLTVEEADKIVAAVESVLSNNVKQRETTRRLRLRRTILSNR